jgi:hypothetical protein
MKQEDSETDLVYFSKNTIPVDNLRYIVLINFHTITLIN